MSVRRSAMNAARLAWRGLATSASPHPGSGAAFAPAALPAHVLAHAPLFAWPLCFRGASMSTWTVIPPCRAARLRTQPLLIRGLAASAAPSGSGGAGTSAGRRSPITFHSMLLGMGAFLGVVALAQNRAQQKVEGMMQRSQEVVGRASVGGPFELIDQDGKRFTHENLLGGFSVLYFGFTHCPDICPDELEKLAVALDIIERNNGGYKVQPVFISVDPARDTPRAVKAYVKEFHPRLIGLTGSEEAVRATSKAYRVYFHKTGDSETDYLVDHSIIMYLIDPAGEFVTFYGKNFTAEQLADSIGQHIKQWGSSGAAGNGSGSGSSDAAARLKSGTAGSQEGLAQR